MLAALLFTSFIASDSGGATTTTLPSARPAPGQRTFSSPIVELTLEELAAKRWRDPQLLTLLQNCLPMTLDATVKHHTAAGGQEDTYLTVANSNDTGFVMWLRDSAGQVAPYMPLLNATRPHVLLDNTGDVALELRLQEAAGGSSSDSVAGLQRVLKSDDQDVASLSSSSSSGSAKGASPFYQDPLFDGAHDPEIVRVGVSTVLHGC
jgi:hypothetical protein